MEETERERIRFGLWFLWRIIWRRREREESSVVLCRFGGFKAFFFFCSLVSLLGLREKWWERGAQLRK
jgi:hypothetical protein